MESTPKDIEVGTDSSNTGYHPMFGSNLYNQIFKNLFVLLILFFCVVNSLHAADKTYGSLKVKNIVKVYDGDTFHANINNVHPLIGDTVSIRVKGIDAPEIRGSRPCEKAKAKEAKAFVIDKLSNAKKIELTNIQRGKYFRILADVLIDGQNLAEMLITAGLAVPYDGGTKLEFVCEK